MFFLSQLFDRCTLKIALLTDCLAWHLHGAERCDVLNSMLCLQGNPNLGATLKE